MRFYTNVAPGPRNTLLVRGYEDGQRFEDAVPYKPYVFLPSKKRVADFQTLTGDPVERFDFDSIKDAKDFIDKYSEVSNFQYYGMTDWSYLYIYDHFKNMDYNPKWVSVVFLDIEVAADEGFPDVRIANKPITAITLNKNGRNYVFGCGEYDPGDRKNTIYIKCKDEATLLTKFLTAWRHKDIVPDVVSGWNVEFFDIPYLYNRIKNVLGEREANKLSPWSQCYPREVAISAFGKKKRANTSEYVDEEDKEREKAETRQTWVLKGLTVLDYIQLYKKFSNTPQPSYKLESIASYELGTGKLDYSEYDSLLELYKNNHQKFIEYNIVDTERVAQLEAKLGFIELVFALAYDAKVTYTDALATVKMWDVIIHNDLMDEKIVVPAFRPKKKERDIIGGFVKVPAPKGYKWVMSFDLTSLYPHLIMQYNISPETLRGFLPGISDVTALAGAVKDYFGRLDTANLACAATGYTFDRDFVGFLPRLMQQKFDQRAVYKKAMLKAQQELENISKKDIDARAAKEVEVAKYKNFQQAKKIQLNSCYGALSNTFFRWFDIRLAESITMSGRLSVQWIQRALNEYLNKLCGTTNYDFVIAIDTDSVYLDLEKLVAAKCPGMKTEEIVQYLDDAGKQWFEPFIEKSFQELADYMNAAAQKMKMKREAIADRGIWTGKKHYALNLYDQEGVRYKEPKIKMVGIEAVRSSTPMACREKIGDALKIMLNGTEDQLIAFIDKFREEYKTLPFDDIASPRGLNGMKKWRDSATTYRKSTPIACKGALVYNRALKDHGLDTKHPMAQEGDKIKFIYLKVPNPVKEKVIAVPGHVPKELNLEKYFDRDKQFEKTFLNPISSFTDAVNWKTEHVATLEAFFL